MIVDSKERDTERDITGFSVHTYTNTFLYVCLSVANHQACIAQQHPAIPMPSAMLSL